MPSRRVVLHAGVNAVIYLKSYFRYQLSPKDTPASITHSMYTEQTHFFVKVPEEIVLKIQSEYENAPLEFAVFSPPTITITTTGIKAKKTNLSSIYNIHHLTED